MPPSTTRTAPARGAALEQQMEKLIAQLFRLYVPAGAVSPERLAQRILGEQAIPVELDTADGLTRAIAIPFDKADDKEEAGHWTALCAAAKALQAEHGFPAPAVSVDGINGYCLWISLEAPVPVAQARQFAAALRAAWLAGAGRRPDALDRSRQLPPCFNQHSGRWAAFIHPGMGASFADEPGLDFAPPPLAQAAFLEGLESVGVARFMDTLHTLQAARPAGAAVQAPGPVASAAPAAPADGPLLRDATLEDIVRHLHAKNIEPTFRHLVPGSR
jgi:hypothetical protein